MIYDHIMQFSDEAEAMAALADVKYRGVPMVNTDEDDNQYWGAAMPVRAILQEAEWDFSDPENPKEVQPEILVPGFFVVVVQAEVNEALKAMPECRSITCREKAGPGKEWHEYGEYLAPDFNEGLLERDKDNRVAKVKVKISPVFAGADYPF